MTQTVTLTKTGTVIDIAIDGAHIASIKDGNNLIARADRHLKAAGIFRSSGYEYVSGVFAALAYTLGR